MICPVCDRPVTCPVCDRPIDGPSESIGVWFTADAHPGCAQDWWHEYAKGAA